MGGSSITVWGHSSLGGTGARGQAKGGRDYEDKKASEAK